MTRRLAPFWLTSWRARRPGAIPWLRRAESESERERRRRKRALAGGLPPARGETQALDKGRFVIMCGC